MKSHSKVDPSKIQNLSSLNMLAPGFQKMFTIMQRGSPKGKKFQFRHCIFLFNSFHIFLSIPSLYFPFNFFHIFLSIPSLYFPFIFSFYLVAPTILWSSTLCWCAHFTQCQTEIKLSCETKEKEEEETKSKSKEQ